MGHPVINTKYALQNNSISKSVYINCTVILNSLSDENAARCRKINDFIHLIRNDILRDSIDAHLLQSTFYFILRSKGTFKSERKNIKFESFLSKIQYWNLRKIKLIILVFQREFNKTECGSRSRLLCYSTWVFAKS